MPFKVQSHLPSIGLELYQLGVHILAKKKKKKKKEQMQKEISELRKVIIKMKSKALF